MSVSNKSNNSAKKISADDGHTDRKSAKLYAVKEIQNKGIFLMKGGVEKATTAFGVNRYTIYNYLDELKKSNP